MDHHLRCICPWSAPSGQMWVKETRGFLEGLRLLFDVPDLDSLPSGAIQLKILDFTLSWGGFRDRGLDEYLFTLLGQDPATLILDSLNHPVALCHWKLATRLLSLLPAGDRDQVLDGKGAEDPGPSGSPELVVSNSHFHLDSCCNTRGWGIWIKWEFCQERIAALKDCSVPMAVANFCWASTFPTIDYL